MLTNSLFTSGILIIALLTFLGIKRKRLSLYLGKMKFTFSAKRAYFNECKRINAEKSSIRMQHKKVSLICVQEDATIDLLLTECGITRNKIIHEIITDKYQIILLDKQIWFVIDPVKIITPKDSLDLQIILEQFAKKTLSPLLLVKQIDTNIQNSLNENNESGNEHATRVIKNLYSSCKLIKTTVYWYTGLNEMAGYDAFKNCVNKLPNTIPSHIYNDKGVFSHQLDQYFETVYNKIAKHSFLGNAEHIEGANVFLKELQVHISLSLKEHEFYQQYQLTNHKNILFLGLQAVNNLTPFTFVEFDKERASYLQAMVMGVVSVGAISFSSYLFSAYQQYKSWENEINTTNNDNLLSTNVVIPTEANIKALGLSNIYPNHRLLMPINNHLANEFVKQVLVPKINQENDLTKKAFLILLASLNDRQLLIHDSDIIADYLDIKGQLAGLNAFLNSNIKVDKNEIPSVDNNVLSAINEEELSKKDIQFYQAYYSHLINDGSNDYQNFINFSVKYDLPIRINAIINHLLSQDGNLITASPKNTAFLDVLGKEQISLNHYLISPKVLADIRSVSDLKNINLGSFIDDTDMLMKDYQYQSSLNISVAKRSSLFLKAAIRSYIATYTEYMLAHSISVVNASKAQMQNSQIELLSIGDYNLHVPVAYTQNYYKTVQAQLDTLNDLEGSLNKLGIRDAVTYVTELKRYVNDSYLKQYSIVYENLIKSMSEMNLSKQSVNEILQTYSLSDSQFYNTLQQIAKNTTFSKEAIEKNPDLLKINSQFAAFNKVVNDKKFIESYQLIMNNMQSQYRASQNSNTELLHNMLTFVDVPNKSPLLKVEALLNENFLPEQYDNIFTLPVTQVLMSIRPYLYTYLVQSWRKNITPQIVAASAYYPFNSAATTNIDYSQLANTFSPAGTINQFIDTAYLPFLNKVDGQYSIKLIDNKDLPRDVQQILAYINTYKKLSNELWDKGGQAKPVDMTISPTVLPEESVYAKKTTYMAASFLALNKDDAINLPQQQAPVTFKYKWGEQDKLASIGWLDENGNVDSIYAARGQNALFSLLKSSVMSLDDNTYYWKVKNSNADIGFKLQSPLFDFVKEVRNYDKV